LGKEVEISVDVSFDGYLNVITVDAKDNTTVLFPNEFNLNNHVNAGSVRIPTQEMAFVLPAEEPLGPTLVVAFLTQERVNFFELGVDGRDDLGVMRRTFTSASPRATRAIGIAAKEKQDFGSGQTTVNVVR
jgi:hypothetical protein